MIGRTGVSSSVARTIVVESRNSSVRPKRTSAREDGSPPTVSSVSSGSTGFWVTKVLKAVAGSIVGLSAAPVSGTSSSVT